MHGPKDKLIFQQIILSPNQLVKISHLGDVVCICCCFFSICFQFSSLAQSCSTLCDPRTAVHQASLSITNPWSLLKLMFIRLVLPSSHLILYRLIILPSVFPSIRVFTSESVYCIRQPTYWSFSFSISPSNEYSGLISFRMDWFDLLAVQGTY